VLLFSVASSKYARRTRPRSARLNARTWKWWKLAGCSRVGTQSTKFMQVPSAILMQANSFFVSGYLEEPAAPQQLRLLAPMTRNQTRRQARGGTAATSDSEKMVIAAAAVEPAGANLGCPSTATVTSAGWGAVTA
jgi:hypothetical protein